MTITILAFTFHTTNVKANLTEKENTVIQTITKNFIETHNISLDDYSFFDFREVHSNKDSLTSQEKSLTNIYLKIAKEQYYMDCSPLI